MVRSCEEKVGYTAEKQLLSGNLGSSSWQLSAVQPFLDNVELIAAVTCSSDFYLDTRWSIIWHPVQP
jgi:hypothetical protein